MPITGYHFSDPLNFTYHWLVTLVNRSPEKRNRGLARSRAHLAKCLADNGVVKFEGDMAVMSIFIFVEILNKNKGIFVRIFCYYSMFFRFFLRNIMAIRRKKN